MLLKVVVFNKTSSVHKVKVYMKGCTNAKVPHSFLSAQLFATDSKVLGHFTKIDPTKPFEDVAIQLEVVDKEVDRTT